MNGQASMLLTKALLQISVKISFDWLSKEVIDFEKKTLSI